MIDRLIVIVPTRGRPQSAGRLIEAWRATSAEARLVFAIDDDDAESRAYADVIGESAQLVCAPRMRMGPTLNYWSRVYAEDHFAVGFMGDDHVPRTSRWDALFLEELRRRPVSIVYGNDLYAREIVPTAVAMTSNIIRTLGFMVPPLQRHLFIDNFWRDLGNALGCLTYRDDIVIEHLHPVAGKSEWDVSYVENNSSTTWSHDELMYKLYSERHLAIDVAKLRATHLLD